MSGMAARREPDCRQRPALACGGRPPGRHLPPGAAAHWGLQGAGAEHDMGMSLFFEDLICEF